MMSCLRSCQVPSGTWSQLIDDPQSCPETFATATATFAPVSGVQNSSRQFYLDCRRVKGDMHGPATLRTATALLRSQEKAAAPGAI